jgi:hypothetical protein
VAKVSLSNGHVGDIRQNKTLGLSGVASASATASTGKSKGTFSSTTSGFGTQTSATQDASTQSDSSQPDAQPTSHSPAAVPAPVVVSNSSSDAALAQAAAITSNAAGHQSAASSSVAGRVTDSTSAADHSNNLQTPSAEPASTQASTGINAARLIQNIGQTEMRVGMHSIEFGNISVRTSVSQQQMSAQISVDHSGLGAAISEKISSVQEKLGSEHGVSASIQVNQNGASFSDAREQSSQRDQKPSFQLSPLAQADTGTEVDHSILRAPPSSGESYRLDIRA